MTSILKNAILITILLPTIPTNAKVNILLGTGATFGVLPEKPDLEKQLSYWALQAISLNCAFQVEHELSNHLVYGLNIHATGLPYPWPYLIFAIGPFFGGQICNVNAATLNTTALYMKGGINYACIIMQTDAGKKSCDLIHGINPYIEFSFRRCTKENSTKEGQASAVIHAIEIGCILLLGEPAENDMTICGYSIIPQIKYKAMWRLA